MARPYSITFGLSTETTAGPGLWTPKHYSATARIHSIAAAASLPGATTAPAIGSSDLWGTEAAVTVHTACAHDEALFATRSVLDAMDQDAAYVLDHHTGRAELWFRTEDPRYRFGIRAESL